MGNPFGMTQQRRHRCITDLALSCGAATCGKQRAPIPMQNSNKIRYRGAVPRQLQRRVRQQQWPASPYWYQLLSLVFSEDDWRQDEARKIFRGANHQMFFEQWEKEKREAA